LAPAAAAAAAGAKPHAAAASQPVSAAQAEALGPALGPAADAEQSADPFDYSVAQDDTIRVAAEETLGHYADWLGVTSARLRELNHLKFHSPVLIGQHIRLDFSRVTREVFETLRHEYHRELQAAYFAGHRIVGTEIRIARPGDSVWTLTQHRAQLPLWLLQQYNPDLDLTALRAGTQIVMPRVEACSPRSAGLAAASRAACRSTRTAGVTRRTCRPSCAAPIIAPKVQVWTGR